MGGRPPSPPPPPDPRETIAAQSAANREAIEAQARFNRVNEVSPTGSLFYTGEPGQPDYTRTVALSPDQQRLLDQREGIDTTTYGLVQSQLDRLAPVLASTINESRLAPQANPLDVTGLRGLVQGAGDADMGQAAQRAENESFAAYERRVRPQQLRQRDALLQSLADRGIAEGSDLYRQTIRDFDQTVSDADRDAALESFKLGESLGLQRSNFANTARGQAVNELSALQMAAMNLRQRQLEEQAYLRQVPISDVASLLGTAQGASMPQVSPLAPVNVPVTQAADIINSNYQNQLAAYNARLAGRSSIFGDLLGVAGQIGGSYLGRPVSNNYFRGG